MNVYISGILLNISKLISCTLDLKCAVYSFQKIPMNLFAPMALMTIKFRFGIILTY